MQSSECVDTHPLILLVRWGQKEKTVPAERSALRFAHRTWPGA